MSRELLTWAALFLLRIRNTSRRYLPVSRTYRRTNEENSSHRAGQSGPQIRVSVSASLIGVHKDPESTVPVLLSYSTAKCRMSITCPNRGEAEEDISERDVVRWGEELAAWWASQIGLALFLERAVIPRRGYPPLFGVAAVLGGTYIMHGTKDSIIMPNENQIQYKITSATSFAPEIRGQIFFDVLHLRQGFLRMYGDVGLGLEWTTIEQATTTIRVQPDESRSIGPLTEVSRYGPDGLLLGGIGLSLGGHFGLATGWDLGLALGVFYQYRGRFTGLQSDKRTDLVPQQQQVLCITLGIDLASPLR